MSFDSYRTLFTVSMTSLRTYAHADIHCARRMGDAVAGAELIKPIRAASAGCHNGLLRVNVVFVLTLRNVRRCRCRSLK